jgi:hypothetical protein
MFTSQATHDNFMAQDNLSVLLLLLFNYSYNYESESFGINTIYEYSRNARGHISYTTKNAFNSLLFVVG